MTGVSSFGETTRKRISLIVSLTFALILVSLGFNTLDWLVWHPLLLDGGAMVWRFDYQPSWHLNSWFVVDIWDAYFFFGILPLSLGSCLFGLCIGALARRKD